MASQLLQAGTSSLVVGGAAAATPFFSSSAGAGPFVVNAGSASCGLHQTDARAGPIVVTINTTALKTNSVVLVGYSGAGAFGSWADTLTIAGSFNLNVNNSGGAASYVSWWIVNPSE